MSHRLIQHTYIYMLVGRFSIYFYVLHLTDCLSSVFNGRHTLDLYIKNALQYSSYQHYISYLNILCYYSDFQDFNINFGKLYLLLFSGH